ncbi:ABC transporter substrate-binding protein, partial [Chloroflexota bacterium]
PNVPSMFDITIDADPEYWAEYAKTQWRYDPDEAIALLAEAGYPSFDLIYHVAQQGGSADQIKQAELVASYWEKVGVNVTLDVVDRSVLKKFRRTLKYPDYVGSAVSENRSETPQGAGSLNSTHHSAGNSQLFGVTQPRIDELIEAGKGAVTSAERSAANEELFRLVSEAYLQINFGEVTPFQVGGSRVDLTNMGAGRYRPSGDSGYILHAAP